MNSLMVIGQFYMKLGAGPVTRENIGYFAKGDTPSDRKTGIRPHWPQ